MRLQHYLTLLVLGICFSQGLAQKKEKKYSSLRETLERLQEEEAKIEAELEEELGDEIDSGPGSVSKIIDFASLPYGSIHEEELEEEIENPCADIFCGAGRECMINEDGEGFCQCEEKCEDIGDDRRKVCSNHNETWPSDCELYRMRCLCAEGSDECRNEKFEHLHIDYYGACQKVPECVKEEMEDFPRRMREWLFNIMRDLADRKQLSEHYLELEKAAEEDDQKRWMNSALWKWCELDGHPKDRSVSRHELFPLRAPLYTLEHCIAPFLDSCDPDGDHYITLEEWTECLKLTQILTEDMADLCEQIRE